MKKLIARLRRRYHFSKKTRSEIYQNLYTIYFNCTEQCSGLCINLRYQLSSRGLDIISNSEVMDYFPELKKQTPKQNPIIYINGVSNASFWAPLNEDGIKFRIQIIIKALIETA